MPNKGYKPTKEHKKKLKEAHIGMKQSETTVRKRMATFKRIGYKPKPPSPLGNKNCLGRKRPQKEKDRISKNNARHWLGKKLEEHCAWQGGLSFEPYSTDWTEELKRKIRERDNHTCQLSGQYGNVVHHIDYDKKNCDPKNLITLSRSWNTRVNFNREYWENYLKNLLLCHK